MINWADCAYNDVIDTVLHCGVRKECRTGHQTISYFNHNYEIDLSKGFPLLTTKYINWKNIVCELLWFISGSVELAPLHKHGVHFWDAWEEEKFPGQVLASYGAAFRDCVPTGIDQLQQLVSSLRDDPYSRRHAVTLWQPGDIYADFPPCHAFFVCNVEDECLNLHLTQRSCDVAVGLPYNMASYALLVHLLAQLCDLEPGKFAHSIVDAHVYASGECNHVPGLKEQLGRVMLSPPTLKLSEHILELEDLENMLAECSTEEILDYIQIVNYEYQPAIKFGVAI